MFNTAILPIIWAVISICMGIAALYYNAKNRTKIREYYAERDRLQSILHQRELQKQKEAEQLSKAQPIVVIIPSYIKELKQWAKKELSNMLQSEREYIATLNVQPYYYAQMPSLTVNVMGKTFTYEQWQALMTYHNDVKPSRKKPTTTIETERFYDESRQE